MSRWLLLQKRQWQHRPNPNRNPPPPPLRTKRLPLLWAENEPAETPRDKNTVNRTNMPNIILPNPPNEDNLSHSLLSRLILCSPFGSRAENSLFHIRYPSLRASLIHMSRRYAFPTRTIARLNRFTISFGSAPMTTSSGT